MCLFFGVGPFQIPFEDVPPLLLRPLLPSFAPTFPGIFLQIHRTVLSRMLLFFFRLIDFEPQFSNTPHLVGVIDSFESSSSFNTFLVLFMPFFCPFPVAQPLSPRMLDLFFSAKFSPSFASAQFKFPPPHIKISPQNPCGLKHLRWFNESDPDCAFFRPLLPFLFARHRYTLACLSLL